MTDDDAGARRGVRLMAAGLLLLQVVWIFAVPPFRGSDEFDHAYRAAAVARGQWVAAPEVATRGSGAWMLVPSHVVEAARPQCLDLKYTGPQDCVGSHVDADTIRVASGAGRYHPLFYAVVGTPSLPFEGNTSLYVMRGVGALLTWSFFLLALAATRCWARTRWPYVALAIGMTPVAVYSSALPAPNGLEMTSAMVLWSALIGLGVRSDTRRDTRLLVLGTTAASVLVTLRSFGPLWCLLILLTVLLAAPVSRRRLREIVVTSKGWVAMLIVLAATLGSVAWIRSMSSLVVGVGPETDPLSVWTKAGVTAREMVLWMLQSIAAFPLRDESTHISVYILFIGVFGTFVVAAFRLSGRRGRTGLVVAVSLSLIVPALVTFSTMEQFGTAWQGRYTLPYAVGIVLVAGLLLDQRRARRRVDVLVTGGLFVVVAQALSPLLVVMRERINSPGVDNGAWVLVPPTVLGALAVVGASLLWWGAAATPQVVVDPDGVDSSDRSDLSGSVVGADR